MNSVKRAQASEAHFRLLAQGYCFPQAVPWLHLSPFCWSTRRRQSALAGRGALFLVHLSLPKHVGRDCGSSGGIPTHPPPRKDGQSAGRVGGRDLPLERGTRGQGALARASHTSCPDDIGRHAPLCKELRFPKALVGPSRRSVVGACVVAKARWPWLPHFRTHSRPPTPLGAKARRPTLLRSRKCPAHLPCGLAPLVGARGWERHAPRAGHPRPRCFGSGGRCCWGVPAGL